MLAAMLGEHASVVEEGLSGRTTDADDPRDARLNGARYLPACLASQSPLDAVVLMLGTNDTKASFERTPDRIASGMAGLVSEVLTGRHRADHPLPRILLVAPPGLGHIGDPWLAREFAGAHEKSARLASVYADLARFVGVDFLDAGEVISTGGDDGIHLLPEDNAALARAVMTRLDTMLG